MGAINTEMHNSIRSLGMRCEDMTAALFAAAHGQAAVLDWALIHIIQLRSKLNTAEEAVRSMEETTRSMIDDIVDLKVRLGEECL